MRIANRVQLLSSSPPERLFPTPGLTAVCPRCHAPVFAKCGPLKVWHFSHHAAACASYLLPETEWTVMWKDKFPMAEQEVLLRGEIYDILHGSTAILLAPAKLDEEQILARDYSPLRWVIDGRKLRLNLQEYENQIHFKWKLSSPGWAQTKAKIFIDLGPRILFVKRLKLYPNGYAYGWGYYNPHSTWHLTLPGDPQ